MTGYIGTSGGRKKVAEMYIGTAAGRKRVEKAYVGTPTGRKVWYARTTLTTTVTATVRSASQIDLTWTATAGATYKLTRTAGHTTGALPNGSTALSYSDTGLSANTTYSYRLDVYRNGVLVGSPTASAKTLAPEYEQKYVELEAVSSAAYNGAGSNRNTSELYYGYYSSSQGQQKSLWCWSIPADVANCVSVDRIDVRVYNIHAYLGAGGSTGLVVHHGAYQGGMPATFPGSSGILQHNGSDWLVGLPKPGYLSQDGSGWMTNIQVLAAPGRASLAEEFRAGGAQGMGLASPTSGNSQYGYAAGAYHPSGQKPAIRIWYTVKV